MNLLGGVLVLATWLAVLLVTASMGLVFVRSRGRLRIHDLLTAAWWGLGIVTLLAYLLAFVVPLGSSSAGLTVVAVTVVFGAVGWSAAIRAGWARPRWSKPAAALAAAFAVAAIYLSWAVLGPVTHFDAGLYQWAAVQYAGDYAVIPGLANLYGPLGYSSAEPALGALLSASPWQSEGYRLLGGLFVLLLGLEALTRTLSYSRRAGSAIAVAGTALVFPPMIWMADFWVASPTPDLPVLVLAIVAAAYLADLVTNSRATNALPTIVVLTVLLTALRPTAVILSVALVTTAVAIALARKRTILMFPIASAALLAMAMAVVVVARDRILSGWLQYPLSVYAFDVPWRAPNPDRLREATLGFARDPENWQQAITGWNWVGPWFERLPRQWEPWWLCGALVAALVLLLVRTSRPTRMRSLAVVAAPFGVAGVLWWVISPPALRFGWGPLFGLTTILLGWSVWRARQQVLATIVTAAGIAVIAAVASLIRLDGSAPRETREWLGIPYAVVPLPVPRTAEFVTDSGLVLRVPSDSNQCWSVYPLCSADPRPSLEQRGPGIEIGFMSQML